MVCHHVSIRLSDYSEDSTILFGWTWNCLFAEVYLFKMDEILVGKRIRGQYPGSGLETLRIS
jgi:hypothetical protein